MAKKILLDAGHFSGYNQSKVYKNYYEGNAMWTLQGLLKKELEAFGFVVGVTRTNRDKDVAVVSRGQMAKGYDMFISLHSNACDTESVDRVVVIKGYNQSDALPKAMGEALTKVMGVKQAHQIMVRKNDNGKDYYGVLRGADSAGVKDRLLIEHGFHTNTATAKWLCNDDNLKKIAKAEAEVIAKYYGINKPCEPSNDNTKKTYYRVIAGSYTNKTNADNTVKKLKGQGIDAFVEMVVK